MDFRNEETSIWNPFGVKYSFHTRPFSGPQIFYRIVFICCHEIAIGNKGSEKIKDKYKCNDSNGLKLSKYCHLKCCIYKSVNPTKSSHFGCSHKIDIVYIVVYLHMVYVFKLFNGLQSNILNEHNFNVGIVLDGISAEITVLFLHFDMSVLHMKLHTKINDIKDKFSIS